MIEDGIKIEKWSVKHSKHWGQFIDTTHNDHGTSMLVVLTPASKSSIKVVNFCSHLSVMRMECCVNNGVCVCE